MVSTMKPPQTLRTTVTAPSGRPGTVVTPIDSTSAGTIFDSRLMTPKSCSLFSRVCCNRWYRPRTRMRLTIQLDSQAAKISVALASSVCSSGWALSQSSQPARSSDMGFSIT